MELRAINKLQNSNVTRNFVESVNPFRKGSAEACSVGFHEGIEKIGANQSILLLVQSVGVTQHHHTRLL